MRDDCNDDPRDREDKKPNRQRRPRDLNVKEEPVGVWLVIRYDEADGGARPIPNGEIHWASPDIWISGGDDLGNAIAGKPTGVHARIWNFGTFAAAPVRVDFHFVAPSIGIPWSAPQLIGTSWINVQPLATSVADCPVPWIPADTGLSHACLIVTCSSPLMDPPDQPGSPRTDRKTGQRNVTVVQAQPGETMEFQLEFARTLGTRGTVDLAAMMTLGDDAPDRFAVDTESMTRTLRHMVATAETPVAPRVARRALALQLQRYGDTKVKRLSAKELNRLIIAKPHAERMKRPEFRMTDPDVGDAILPLAGNLDVEPLTPTKVDLRVQTPDARGTAHLHVFQFEDGNVTGGHSFVIRQKK